jgi:hypothetical protein
VARRASAYPGYVLDEAPRLAPLPTRDTSWKRLRGLRLRWCEPEAPCLGDRGRRGDVERNVHGGLRGLGASWCHRYELEDCRSWSLTSAWREGVRGRCLRDGALSQVRSERGVALHLVMTGVPYPSPLRGIEKAELMKDNVNVVGVEFVARRRYVTRLPRSGAPFEVRLVRSRLSAVGHCGLLLRAA